MKAWWERLGGFSSVFMWFALGLSFLSAVVDRFGGSTLDADPSGRGWLKAVFLPEYGVSLAERGQQLVDAAIGDRP
jgi:hypothetical protein